MGNIYSTPQAPDYEQSPNLRNYLDDIRTMGEPGADYQQTPYYQQLQNQVTETMRSRGLGNGDRAAQSGVMTPGAYGANQRQNTEAARTEAQLRTQASSQARQQAMGDYATKLNALLQQAGFEKGLMDSRFANEFRQYAAEHGLSLEETEAQVQQMQMLGGMIGQMGLLAAMA